MGREKFSADAAIFSDGRGGILHLLLVSFSDSAVDGRLDPAQNSILTRKIGSIVKE